MVSVMSDDFVSDDFVRRLSKNARVSQNLVGPSKVSWAGLLGRSNGQVSGPAPLAPPCGFGTPRPSLKLRRCQDLSADVRLKPRRRRRARPSPTPRPVRRPLYGPATAIDRGIERMAASDTVVAD